MRVVNLSNASPDMFKKPVATIGFFDGFHVGHTTLLSRLVGWGRSRGSDTIVLTFKEHPKSVVSGSAPLSIMCPHHRLVWFERLLVDVVVMMEFDDEIASMSAKEFVEDVLIGRLGVSGLLMGWDSCFGARGEGNADYIRRGPWNIEVRTCPPVWVGSLRPSSTLIRRLILKGDLQKVKLLLGHHHTLWGRVVRGEGRGKRMGVPTVNLLTKAETLPPDGVYGGRAVLPDGSFRWALINIGPRPTFSKTPKTVEAHLLDFSEEIYGKYIEIEIHRFIRSIRPFPDGAALKKQIDRDIKSFLLEIGVGGRDA